MSEPATVTETQVRVRRSPKILQFLITGAVVGAIVALILTLSFPPNDEFSPIQVFGFLLLICVVAAGILAGLAAIITDAILSRRIRTLTADRLNVARDPSLDEPTNP
jgi:peptidoglycan/LPS O-acetylase OafA/YrhL